MFVKHPLITPNMVEMRKYQDQISKSALQQNTLVVLPTGTGKSAVALFVMAERLRLTGKKVVMLAPTKPLVEQHQKYYRRLLILPPEDIVMFTGAVKAEERKLLWEKAKVILATPQTIRNDIDNKLYHLKDVSLIVFDECHHTSGEYAYGQIAVEYSLQNMNNGLMLGMTASPGAKKEQIDEIKDALGITHVEIRSETDSDVMEFLHDKVVTPMYLELPEELRHTSDLLTAMLGDRYETLRGMGFQFQKGTNVPMKVMNQIKMDINARISVGDSLGYAAASVHAEIMKLKHAIGLVESQGSLLLKKYFDKMYTEGMSPSGSKASKRLLSDCRFKELYEMSQDWMTELHPKFHILPTLVLEELSDNPDSKMIVFATYRDTVSGIVTALKAEGISCTKFVGQSGKGDNKGLSQKEQVKTMDLFREGKFRVIVSTSVGEEGLDVPACDGIIFFEPVASEVRSIQRRGRTGRFDTGRVSVLITRNTIDEVYWNVSKRKESDMHDRVNKMRVKEAQQTLNLSG